MKRYTYIIIGIIVAAIIAIAILFAIKLSSGNPSSGSAGTLGSTSSTTGSLPTTGTGNEGSGVNGNGASGGSTGAATTTETLSLPASSASGVGSTSSGSNSGSGSSTPAAVPGGQMTVQGFGPLSSNPVLDYFVNAQNNITAIEPTGAIISISGGQTTTLNASTTDGIISASFSYDGTMVLVSYGDPNAPRTEVFSHQSNSWTALPQDMLSPQWSPVDNYEIGYLTKTSGGELSLDAINAANLNKGASILTTLNAQDLTLQWPSADEFILSDKPTYQDAGSIWAFNSQAGTLTSLIYETPGAEAIWSHNPAIPYGLVFFDNAFGEGSTLELQPISGNLPTQQLSVLTLPSKCAFNSEQTSASSSPYLALYCGIPRSSSGFSSAQLPDAYNMMALFTSDDIYKINTATGAVQVLWSDATQNMDVSDVKFFNNALFFVNRYDQKLYGLTFTQ